ncbi:hypothetical protein FNF31_06201 [Cafeteria roenbergensis]|uniref:FACT complex subunit n=1 Tax=Cafeteria roenbergensis TaxID=33653 RepID=A0A5A8D777_CAFRO|nr:hypothetical protein FNF31_06201 [Cafeteria roenbergensis]KAA0160477.1 hypothetical protein FNF28_05433 [Cafeteria roenbergensis]
MDIVIPGPRTLLRLAKLRDQAFVHDRDAFGKVAAVSLVNGKREEKESLATSMQLNVLDYEFPSTLMVLFADRVVFVSTKKKLSHLEDLRATAEAAVAGKLPASADGDVRGMAALKRAPLAVELRARAKSGDDDVMSKLAEEIKAAGGSAGAGVGVVAKAPGLGDFAKDWRDALEAAGVSTADCTAGLVQSMAIKDRYAAEAMKQAGLMSAAIMRKKFHEAFTTAIEDGKMPSLAELSKAMTEAGTEDPRTISKTLKGLDHDALDIGLPACVQSGSSINVDIFKATPSTEKLTADTAVFSFGARYRSFHAVLARTLFVNTTRSQTEAYKALTEAHGTLLEGLKAGSVIGDVVKEARAILSKGVPGATIPECMGSGVGVLVEEPGLRLTEDNTRTVEEGMSFAVVTAVKDAPNEDFKEGAKGNAGMKTFCQVLADSIVVMSAADPHPTFVLTNKADRDLGKVRFYLEDEEGDEDDDEDGEEEDDDDDEEEEDVGAYRDQVRRSSRIKEAVGDTDQLRQEREQRALQLVKIFERSVAERRAELDKATGGSKETPRELAVRKAKPIRAYDSPAEYPVSAAPNRVFVDKERQCVLLPMYGQLVPFHVACIRSVTKKEEGGRTVLRINFYGPGQSAGKTCPPAMVAAMEQNPYHAYVRVLSYQSKEGRNLSHAERLIKDIQKRMHSETAQRTERSNLVKQPKLLVNRAGKVPRLQRLNMWPHISGRKSVGALEAHTNGLRFRAERGEILDIIYDNIRHAIFQPCKKDLYVIIHFHLHHPIMVGKKKHRDIKFFTEVMESAQSLEGTRRSMYDPDELAEEQRERNLRQQLNKAFRNFVQKTELVAQSEPHSSALEFDAPSRDLSFHGRALREMVEISPCRDCIVSLSENPPFVLSLDDVEHVHFERVIYGAKNFDIAFVLKASAVEPGQDEVRMVTMVPMQHLDTLQKWLVDVVEQLYTQGTRAMNWKTMMAVAREPSFYSDKDEDGEPKPIGWAFLMDSTEGGEEEEDEEEEGEAFEADDDDDDDDDDEEFDEAVDDEEEEEDDDDEDGDEFEEDDEEEVADWETMERNAMEEDRRAEALDRERSRKEGASEGAGSSSRKRPRDGGERSSGKRSKRA